MWAPRSTIVDTMWGRSVPGCNSLRLGVYSSVHHLAYLLRIVFGHGVGKLRLFVASGRHSLVVLVVVLLLGGGVGGVEARLDEGFARLRRDHGLGETGGRRYKNINTF